MSKLKPVTLFIVDDNRLFALALKTDLEIAFETMHLNILLFETGEKCMEQFKLLKPQVVILDYNLNAHYPHAADGLKILDRIKKAEPKTNVIMHTSEDNIPLAVKLLEHGASDYIIKTENRFRKINHSLVNIFRTMEVNTYKLKYQQALIGVVVGVALLTVMAISALLYNYVMLA